MGSSLSGRRSDKSLAEDSLKFDLAEIMRVSRIKDGGEASGKMAWSVGGEQIASAKFRLDLRSVAAATLILTFDAPLPDGRHRGISQEIALTSTSQNFGGRRWWMRCPVTAERVRKLYRPEGAIRFAGRRAWNLGYKVERLSHFDRPFEKLFRAQRKLGGPEGLAMGITRPRGMWRRTFARRLEKFAALDMQCAEAIVGLMNSAS